MENVLGGIFMSINKSAASRSSGRNQASDQIPTNKQEDYSHYFDDDFEVIYDGDLPDLPSEEDDDDDYYDVLSNLSELDHTKKIDYVKENVDKPRQKERRCEKAQEKKKRRMPNLLSPAARTAKTGARAALQVANMLLRCATLILILLIMWLLARNFWDNHSALGNIARMVSEKNYVLGGYTGVALFLLLFELITFLIVLFGKKRSSRNGRLLDTGRGLLSFIIIYIGSYLSALLYTLVPASPEALQGVQAALLVYGSLQSALLPLCTAGVVSCLVRRFLIR